MTTTMTTPHKEISITLAEAPRVNKVDTLARTLRDVVLIQAYREASGHGIYIDGKSIQGALDSIETQYNGKLRAYWTHWRKSEKEYGDEMSMAGWFEDLRIEDNQLIAGKFEFFESFATANPNIVAQALEMAEKTPELFMQSIEPAGYLVFIDAEGNEYSEPPTGDDAPELLYDGLPVMRITRVKASAFVDDGAATTGLFTAFRAFFKRFSLADHHDPAPVSIPTPADEETPTPINMIKEIKAACGEDAETLARALLLHAEDESLSLEDITAILENEDEIAELEARADLASDLEARIAELETALAAKDEAIAALNERIEQAAKDVGEDPVDLGLAADGGELPPADELRKQFAALTDATERAAFWAKHSSQLLD
jgi:DNA-binding transcriptional MerR regulator